MKNDPRPIAQRYRRGHEASQVLKQVCHERVGPLIGFLEHNLHPQELISVHEWHDEFFYIEILDTRFGGINKPSVVDRMDIIVSGMRLGLTVDVKRDMIVWSNMPYCPDTSSPPLLVHGGNCYVRANKWKKLMKERFNMFCLGFRNYKHVNPPQ